MSFEILRKKVIEKMENGGYLVHSICHLCEHPRSFICIKNGQLTYFYGCNCKHLSTLKFKRNVEEKDFDSFLKKWVFIIKIRKIIKELYFFDDLKTVNLYTMQRRSRHEDDTADYLIFGLYDQLIKLSEKRDCLLKFILSQLPEHRAGHYFDVIEKPGVIKDNYIKFSDDLMSEND